jgi:hypothetical protein
VKLVFIISYYSSKKNVNPIASHTSKKSTLREKVHPTLIIQELQVIKCIKQHNINYQQDH